MLNAHHVNRGIGPRPIYITISANVNSVNLFTLAGSPAGMVTVNLTIAAGVKIYGNPGLRTGGFSAGSSINIVNHGRIAGFGGGGGNGGNANSRTNGNGGGNGSDAIQLDSDITLDNTDGQVFGGGGGGGGGGAVYYDSVPVTFGGGGGSGGTAYGDYGGGGAGATGTGATGYAATDEIAYAGGHDGNDQSSGGRGGGYGSGGSAGVTVGTTGFRQGTNGGVGGAAGKAVALNGHAITWTGGNNSQRVKGAVS